MPLPRLYLASTRNADDAVTEDRIFAFLAFAFSAAVTPGPSNLLVMSAAARAGIVGALPCLAGVVAGMALLIGASVLGLGALLAAWPQALMLLRVGGAAFLLWLAWRIATAPPLQDGDAGGAPAGFTAALLFQWVNPKSWLAGASAAGAFAAGIDGSPLRTAALLALLFAAAALPSCALWLLAGSALQRWMRDARRARAFNVAMALLLAASVVLVVR